MSSIMSSTRTITIETIAAGQPHAYADSQYIAELEFSEPWTPNEARVKEIAKVLVKNFKEKGEGNWYEAYLGDIIQLSKHRWLIKIIEPYTD